MNTVEKNRRGAMGYRNKGEGKRPEMLDETSRRRDPLTWQDSRSFRTGGVIDVGEKYFITPNSRMKGRVPTKGSQLPDAKRVHRSDNGTESHKQLNRYNTHTQDPRMERVNCYCIVNGHLSSPLSTFQRSSQKSTRVEKDESPLMQHNNSNYYYNNDSARSGRHRPSSGYIDSLNQNSAFQARKGFENGVKLVKKDPNYSNYSTKHLPNNQSSRNSSVPPSVVKMVSPMPKRTGDLVDSTLISRKIATPDKYNQSSPRSRSTLPNGKSTLRKSAVQEDLANEPNAWPSITKRDSSPQKLYSSVENESVANINDSSEGSEVDLKRTDSFFEKVMAYDRSKGKENATSNSAKNSQAPSSPSGRSNSPVRNGFRLKSQAPVKKASPPIDHTRSRNIQQAGSPNGFIDYDKSGLADHPAVNPSLYEGVRKNLSPVYGKPSPTSQTFGENVRGSPTRAIVGSQMSSTLGYTNESASPQVAPTRTQMATKLFQEPKAASNVNAANPVPWQPSQTPTKNKLATEDRQTVRLTPSTMSKPLEKKSSPPSPGEEKAKVPSSASKRPSPRVGQCISPSKNQVPYSDKKVIIIDMGHYYVRVGVLRDQPTRPDLCLPNTIGVTSTGLFFGDAVPQLADPEIAKELDITRIISPLRQNQITSPINIKGVPIQKVFFQHILQRLGLSDKGYKLLLCLPTRASALRTYFIDYFLSPASAADEVLSAVEAVGTISTFRAALQTSKISTCLIISISADLEIIPVAEGTLVEHGRSTVALYGEVALRSLMEDLVNWGVGLNEKEVDCYGHYIYQKAAFIENAEKECQDVVVDLSEYAPYPLNKRINVPMELRQRASDALLRPEQALSHDGEAPSFKALLNRAIHSCDVHFRNAICSNVIIIGEFAEIEGLRERVGEELHALLPEGTPPPNVQVSPSAAEAAYEGASLLAAVLQGPRAPPCPWFRFLDAHDWSLMRLETRATTESNKSPAISTSSSSDTRLLNRLNRDCVWP